MRADVVVIDGNQGDPYEALIKAKETSIRLVMINGVARYGVPQLMGALGAAGQTLSVGGEKRRLFLQQATGDPDVVGVSLSTARSALHAAFRDLPKLARELEKPTPKKAARAALDASRPVVWSLTLDEIQAHRGRPTPEVAVQRPARLHRAQARLAKRCRSAALEDSRAHRAGPSHRGRRSRFPAEDRG